MKSWVLTWRVPPPSDVRVTVRHGGSVCDAYFSKLLRQWFMLVPGGNPEKLAAPTLWFCDEDYARDHQRKITSHDETAEGLCQGKGNCLRASRRRKKVVQMSLFR